MGTGGSFPGDKVAGAAKWSLTFIQCPVKKEWRYTSAPHHKYPWRAQGQLHVCLYLGTINCRPLQVLSIWISAPSPIHITYSVPLLNCDLDKLPHNFLSMANNNPCSGYDRSKRRPPNTHHVHRVTVSKLSWKFQSISTASIPAISIPRTRSIRMFICLTEMRRNELKQDLPPLCPMRDT